jgi:DNA polymerase-1
MLVTRGNFEEALSAIIISAEYDARLGFDTETTCLNWWDSTWHSAHGIVPRVFSMQFSNSEREWYFDFNHSPDKLGDEHFAQINSELTQNPNILWFIANAKFDLHHCRNHGVDFAGEIHDTNALSRVMNNLESDKEMNLDSLSEKYLGVGKLDVISLLKERGHVTQVKKFGHNDKFDEVLHFDRLTLSELVEYGKRDTRLCFDLGAFQIKKIEEIDKKIYESDASISPQVRLSAILENERKLTKILFEMEHEGVPIDRPYTERAYEHECVEYGRVATELEGIARTYGIHGVDWLSAKQLKPLFDKAGEPYSYTEKGNASFDRDALEASESALAKLILKYRYHYKRAHTYFENFIWMADKDGVLHANAQQLGTSFGRMSYWTPNLQNIPKRRDKDEAAFKVRRCFIPKPGFILADFDYSGAEYYLTLDYARELPIIEMLKNGLDPHEKLRADMGLKDRDSAKTMQFRILYGGGQEAVGRSLGLKGEEAKRIGKIKKAEYFERLPAVASLIAKVSSVAKNRKYIFNWAGRLLQYDYQTAYKATNGLIQSGVGDMTKFAMVKIFELLKGTKSHMLIQVHDSIVFSLHPDDVNLVPLIKETMQRAYPHKVLAMEADAAFSTKSWADLTDTIPSVG